MSILHVTSAENLVTLFYKMKYFIVIGWDAPNFWQIVEMVKALLDILISCVFHFIHNNVLCAWFKHFSSSSVMC